MINDTIKQIDDELANAGILSLEDFPYWARLRQKTSITKTEDNHNNYLRYLQNKLDSYPYAKSELQQYLKDTEHWNKILNLFNILRNDLESEYQNIAVMDHDVRSSDPTSPRFS